MDTIISEWWYQLLKERKCWNTSKTVKIVHAYPQTVQENVRVYISDHIKETILEVMQRKDIDKRINLCAAINGCFDNFPYAADGVNIAFNEIVKFIDLSIDDCKNGLAMKDCAQMKKVKWIELIHSLSRILVLVLKLRRPLRFEAKDFHLPEIAFYDKRVLLGLAYKVSDFFKLKEMSMDTKCTLAMASMLIREILVEKREKLAEYHKEFLATLPGRIDEKEYELNVYKFLLANAILNTWSGILIDATSTEAYLRFFIQLCECYSSDTGIILNLSRTLLLLIKNECFTEFMNDIYRKEFDLVNPLLSCIYMLLDHPVPCVRHSSKEFPRLLAGYEEFNLSMMESLRTILTDKRSYFICLGALAEEVGSQTLLTANESLMGNLFLALQDPALVTYVIDALRNIIVNDYLMKSDFSMWCERWIVPLLTSLSNVHSTTKSEIEKLLQGLLAQYPPAIYFIITKWFTPKNDEELCYIMIALKVYNKLSLKYQKGAYFSMIDTSYDYEEDRWRGIISEKLLRCCLSHNDDDLRLSAFALIVEGLKSTERYTEQDFSLIQYSLKYNLNNQQPATRQKFLSLMKKMLTRFADSLAVVEKNLAAKPDLYEMARDKIIYQTFQDWLLDFCFSNIYENANFNRLYTILSVILDCAVILKDLTVEPSMVDDYWRKLLVPLRGSYEENKKMAVLLIKKLKILKAYKNTGIIRLIFEKAYDLCGKIEPPNVLTGAYMMQTLLEYPSLDKAIEGYEVHCKTYSMEQFVVVLLSNKLEQQICISEKSFIEKATDNPMYGTLFAIRIILQQTDFSPVSDTPENEQQMEIQRSWSEILRNLIGFSFRMIKIVSCVVNSSSPESLLPSDFERNFYSVFPRHCELMEEEDYYNDAYDDPFGEIASSIQSIKLEYLRTGRSRAEMNEDSERLMKYCNNLFFSYGESRYFSHQIAMVFRKTVTSCTQLICDLEGIEQQSNLESKYLKCLKSMKTRLKKFITIHERNSDRVSKPTSQVLLLCSWRSIKEACLFLGDVVSKLPLKTWIESELITEETLVTIGMELRTLLCEINHRGAFEHAYVGFSNLITAFWKCPLRNLNELPQKWLEEILCEIKQPTENQKMKFCSSRRSAGLPFLIQAIICSEVKCTNSAKIHTLDVTMHNLLPAAELGSFSSESTIHSLNILRSLFKHALLGDYVAPYVSQGVMVAIRGSRSMDWAVRNSSCLLFSALIIRIFGVARDKDALSKKNRMTARHFFQRYPELYQFFLSEMELAFEINVPDIQFSAIPSLQPHLFLILLILGRLYPSPNEDAAGNDFSEFLPYVNASCCNPVFKIREFSARALVPLISSDTFIEALEIRFFNAKSILSDINYVHGTLFQIKTILLEIYDKKKLFEEAIRERAEKWIADTESLLDVTQKATPYMIKITYIQILHLLFKINVSLGEKLCRLIHEKEIIDYVSEPYKIHEDIPGRCAYLETLHFIKFDMATHIWSDTGSSDYMIGSIVSMLKSDIEEVQAVALVFLRYITSEKFEDLAEEDENNLITVNLQDLFCIQDEEKFKVIATEILSDDFIIKLILESFVTILINIDDSKYLYKMTTKLKLSVFSNFMLRGLVSIKDITDSYTPQMLSDPIMDLLPRIIKCDSTDLSVGAFICYGVFFFENIKDDIELEPSTSSYFTNLLFNYSDADADVKHRMAVSELFNKYYDCFTHNFFKADNRAMAMWILPVKLLSDEDPTVRKRLLEMVHKYQQFCREHYRHNRLKWEFEDVYLSQLTGSPYKAQETLLDCYISLLDRDDLIHIFVPIVAFMLSAYINTINYEHSSKLNEEGIFEKGNPNSFCEDMTFGRLLSSKVKQYKVIFRLVFTTTLDPIHVASLKEFFPTLILTDFPERLYDFCIEILRIVVEGYTGREYTSVSFLPIYLADLFELCDV